MNVLVLREFKDVVTRFLPGGVSFPDEIAVVPLKADGLFCRESIGGDIAVGCENMSVKVSLVVLYAWLVDRVLSHHALLDQVVGDESAHQVFCLLPVELCGNREGPFPACDGI